MAVREIEPHLLTGGFVVAGEAKDDRPAENDHIASSAARAGVW